MIQEQEFVSWLGFPDVPSWAPFAPRLEVSPQLGPDMSAQQKGAQRFFHADSLAQAVRFLSTERCIPLVYRAFPELSATADGSVLEFTHELDWPILHPPNFSPELITDRSKSALYCEREGRVGYFRLTASPLGKAIHLVVGGRSAEDCRQNWLTVSAWIRALYDIQYPGRKRWQRDVHIPLVPRQISGYRHRNQRIREELLRAAKVEAEKAAFELSGRGHEPRVSLNVRLAAIVRGVDLPVLYIAGFGANNFYPLRVFKRAAAQLKREFGRPIILFSWGYRGHVAGAKERLES